MSEIQNIAGTTFVFISALLMIIVPILGLISVIMSLKKRNAKKWWKATGIFLGLFVITFFLTGVILQNHSSQNVKTEKVEETSKSPTRILQQMFQVRKMML